MKKTAVRIPVHKETGNVPHWCEDQGTCESQIARFKSILEAGFQNPKFPDGSPMWETKEDWRAWVEDGIRRFSYEWREPWEFEDTLRVESFGRGRSAAYFTLASTTTGAKYCMFMKDMIDMVQNATITKGFISGRWVTCKRGQNYGVRYLP